MQFRCARTSVKCPFSHYVPCLHLTALNPSPWQRDIASTNGSSSPPMLRDSRWTQILKLQDMGTCSFPREVLSDSAMLNEASNNEEINVL